jgi:hypothetical protein
MHATLHFFGQIIAVLSDHGHTYLQIMFEDGNGTRAMFYLTLHIHMGVGVGGLGLIHD